jgi:hypothetical protein
MFYESAWPALWPAALAALLLHQTRQHMPVTLTSVVLQIVLGGTFYIGLFMLAVGGESRREYFRHADALLRRTKRQMSHVGTANASS